ncbi:MAG: hypothetical protein WBX30_09155, partial [Stellaceae bacterium]
KGGSVKTPADLIGKRIGMYDWVASGSIWYRHFLRFIEVPPRPTSKLPIYTVSSMFVASLAHQVFQIDFAEAFRNGCYAKLTHTPVTA